MQLDKTAIAIKQRNLDELLDLSLAVLRRFGPALLQTALLGALPFALLNGLLLSSSMVMRGYLFDQDGWLRFRFLVCMAMLVYTQAPLAMAGVTIKLGNLMFGIQSSKQQTLKAIGKQWFSVFGILAMLRGIFPMIALIGGMEYFSLNRDFANYVGTFWISMVAFMIAAIRSVRPFAPEILFLEKCPLFSLKRKESRNPMLFGQRSKRLHQAGGELFQASFFAGIVSAVFLLILNLTFVFLVGSLAGAWEWGWWMDLFFYPLALWAIALWGTILRFLVYMNTRIGAEGWELELKLKAEATRFQDAEAGNRVE
ncbi:MAG: hypothetical protein DWH99_16715 [Planctomycetota bacterium]|nr:MAG: hypothetical protein DWH99_16715 [Planctomycetota bacterium]